MILCYIPYKNKNTLIKEYFYYSYCKDTIIVDKDLKTSKRYQLGKEYVDISEQMAYYGFFKAGDHDEVLRFYSRMHIVYKLLDENLPISFYRYCWTEKFSDFRVGEKLWDKSRVTKAVALYKQLC